MRRGCGDDGKMSAEAREGRGIDEETLQRDRGEKV